MLFVHKQGTAVMDNLPSMPKKWHCFELDTDAKEVLRKAKQTKSPRMLHVVETWLQLRVSGTPPPVWDDPKVYFPEED